MLIYSEQDSSKMIQPDASNAKKYRLNAKYDQFALFYIESYEMQIEKFGMIDTSGYIDVKM